MKKFIEIAAQCLIIFVGAVIASGLMLLVLGGMGAVIAKGFHYTFNLLP